ncbi:hypothetical protein [Acidianus brierleyi]|uniref:Nucleotidyltransferase n=1 Tax=Acidianus brierleyi TaxID=41673 RepID=A0A2U9IHP5_9CREN|nr:hypothetical protein [Acidianus brierleyi]AWR95567.1 hypothetical protein DFR85_14185 [Acidianus brierleyi]
MSNISPTGISEKKISFEEIISEYLKIWKNIYNELEKNNIKALIYGSVAIYYKLSNLPEAIDLIKSNRKNGPQDLNVIVPLKFREKFKEILMKMEFTPYYHLEVTMGNLASMFLYNQFTIKVYYMDKAEFNHDVDIDWNQEFSLSLTDLLLTKLQIHYPTDKDSADIAAILLKYDEIDKEKICIQTSKDWGFWKDAVDNLNNARTYVSRLQSKSEKLKNIITASLKLYGLVNNYPKPNNWKPLNDEKYWRDF